jgi:uncharacterized protein with GYD domain
MTTFVTQGRFTKEGLKRMVAAPEDHAEVVGQLIAQGGGKLIGYYVTSGDYDMLLIFEGPSYEDVVPALIVAVTEIGVADLKTVTALKSEDVKVAFAKAASIAANYRSAGAPVAGLPVTQQQADAASCDSQNKGTANEARDDAKVAADLLDAREKTMEDIKAGRPAPYFLASAARATDSADPAKE